MGNGFDRALEGFLTVLVFFEGTKAFDAESMID